MKNEKSSELTKKEYNKLMQKLTRDNFIISKLTDLTIKHTIEYLKFVFMNKIYPKYGTVLSFKGEVCPQFQITLINKWIKSYDKLFYFHTRGNKIVENTAFIIKLDNHTFALILAGFYMYNRENFKLFRGTMNARDLTIYIFGKNYIKYESQLKKKACINNDINDYRIPMINIVFSTRYAREGGETIVRRSYIKPRYFDTLFYDKSDINEIMGHIDNHLKKRNIHEKRNIIFKTGLLLTGVPGVGKSSLIRAISTKYDAPIINIDMTNFVHIDCSVINEIIDEYSDDSEKNHDFFLVTLEDIDCIFESSLNRENNASEETRPILTKNDANVINKLLELLDSASSPNNVIFIATTNYPEKLCQKFNMEGKGTIQFDTALMRGKRLEKTVEIHEMTRDVAVNMCNSFGISEDKIDDILDNVKTSTDGRYNQSEVEKVLFTMI